MYSGPPKIIKVLPLVCPEMMFVQYMPVKMAGSPVWLVPHHLQWLNPLFEVLWREWPCGYCDEDYVYVTAKCMYIPPGCLPNRGGWHIDGFGTDDISYIWSDCMPTEFCVQSFDLPTDHEGSMLAMENQAYKNHIETYGDNTMLKLGNTNVHRVAVSPHSGGMRTFAKISVSREKYALKGNAHNYLFDYNWDMHERQNARNCPQHKGTK